MPELYALIQVERLGGRDLELPAEKIRLRQPEGEHLHAPVGSVANA